jgi:PAS domain S-box-containing protein
MTTAIRAALESEDLFRLAADAAPTLVWTCGADKLCNYVNKPWLAFTGRAMDSELGNGRLEGVYAGDQPRSLASFTEAFDRRQPFRMEYRLRRHDGEYRWMLDTGVPRFNGDGSFAGYIASCVDVTDFKRAETEGACAVERLHLAMESGKSVGWDWDLKTGRDTWFGDLLTMFGIPSKMHVGGVEDFRRAVHPDDRGLVWTAVEDARQSHTPYVAEFRVRWPDGTVRWVAATGKFLYSADDEPERMLGMAVDVTERKQAEESLRSKEMELTEAQRLAGIGSWQWDPDSDSVVWSEQLYRLVGRDPSLPAVSYKDHAQLYTPESWGRLRSAVEHALRIGTPFELDVEMVRGDGTTRWLTARGEVQRNAVGRIAGLRGTVQDITERRQREESLVLFRNLIESSSDALEVVDPETLRFLDVNEQACRDLGRSREELLRLTVRDIDLGLDESLGMEPPKPCGPGGVVVFESVRRRKDGSTFPVEINLRHVALDRRYLVCVVRDITERKLAQQSLRESEERLRLAAVAGKMFAYTWDAVTDVIVRSGESAHILGIADSTPTTGREVLARIHPDDRERVGVAVTGLTPESPDLQITYRVIRPDGTVIWLEGTSRAYFDDNGSRLRSVGMVADITPRKLAEEALSSVSRRLIEAQETERARIARDLHDDIGQGLALLTVTLDQIKHVTADSSGEVRRCMDQLQRQISEITASVQALSHDLHPFKLQLLGVVAAMKSFCTELSELHRVEIDFTHQDISRTMPPKISLCLFRVLQEALHNAVRYSGVRRFSVQLRGTSHEVQLIVRDAGIGFDPETAAQGRGLGLTSMKERLKLAGGELSIQSELTRGTTIVAWVPLINQEGSL